MASYFTPSGLAAIAQTESSGNPTAVNPSSGASGLYGFLDSTWRSIAPQAGVDVSLYPTAASAPPSVQTSVAAISPISNWTCPGCNSLASSIASVPGNTTPLPLSGGGQTLAGAIPSSDSGASFVFSAPNDFTPGGGSGDTKNFTPPSTTPDTFDSTGSVTPNQPVDPSGTATIPGGGNSGIPGLIGGGIVNLIPGLGPLGTLTGQAAGAATGNQAGTGGDFFANAANIGWNFAQRFGLIILAIVLVGVGAFWLAASNKQVQQIVRTVKP
jgi:hypothetical protein